MINAIHPTFAKQLGLCIRLTDVGVQKNYGTMLDTNKMIVATFLMIDKGNRVRFFEEIFLLTNVSLEVIFQMLFLTLRGPNIDFLGWELWWKTYTTKKAFPTIKRVGLVGKKGFAAAALDSEYETFIVYVVSLSSTPLNARSQIFGLITKEAPIKILAKYLAFADVFTSDLASKPLEYIRINDHAIELVDG